MSNTITYNGYTYYADTGERVLTTRLQSALANNLFEQFTWLFNEYISLPQAKAIFPGRPDIFEDMQNDGHPEDLDLALLFSDFIKVHKQDGMKALIGYVQWSRKNVNDPVRISQTIVHDLADRNQPCMLPRSSGYLEYYQDAATARAAIRKFPWVKRLHQAHLYTSGNIETDCGMPMLGNNYANLYPTEDWKLCEECHPGSKAAISKSGNAIHYPPYEPDPSGHNWKPLERLCDDYEKDETDQWGQDDFGPMYVDEFMHMGSFPINNVKGRREIQLYKHIDTRCYLNIDNDGILYKYESDSGEYVQTTPKAAIAAIWRHND